MMAKRLDIKEGRPRCFLFHAALYCTFVLCCAIAFGQASQSAQKQHPKTAPATEQILTSYEGQKVSAIEIAGRPDLSRGQFASSFYLHAGEPFSRELLDKTISALKQAGHFPEIQVQVDPEYDGVRVLLILEPATYFGIFKFPGAERFAYPRLVQVANYPPEAPFNADDIDRDRQALLKFFQEEGFFRAEVRPEVQIDEASSLANIFFHVQLNHRAKFGAVVITDSSLQETAQLTASLHKLPARLRGSAIRPGKAYHRTTLTNAAHYLQGKLEKEGRLSGQVKLEGAEYIPESNRADIHFSIDPGPLVHVEVKGAHLWGWTKKSLLPVYQGVGADTEVVQEGRQALISYFQAKGYFDVNVGSQYKSHDAVDTITYQITKEKKHKVTSVSVSGNTKLPSSELTSRLVVAKSHLFSLGKYSQALVRTSVKNLTAVYKSNGFSSVHVTSSVINHGGDIKISFQVNEGPQDIVRSLQIDGADTFPKSSYAPAGLKLEAGHAYSQQLVESDRASVIANYLKAGYLTASFRETARADSKEDPHHIDVVYHIYEGPRVYTANILTLGRTRTQQRLINEDIASIKPDHPLTETQLLTAESDLYNHTGVFDWAEVDPKRQITTQTSEDVLVKVHEANRNQITYGFGFEVINRGGSVPSGTVAIPNLPPIGLPSTFTTSETTFYGPRGTFEYTRNNVRGKGESFSFTGFAGRLDQRAAVYYIDPRFFWSKWGSTASVSYERDEENPIFSSQVELASYQLQRFLGKGKANTLFLRYSYSKTDLTRIEIPALVLPADQHVKLSTVAVNFTHDTRDNPLDEHKGWLDIAEFDLNPTSLGSSVNFVKFNGQVANYKQIFHKTVWANSLRVGLAEPYSGSVVPLSEAFFTGGGNTLRGFPLDGAGPQRQVPVCSSGSSTDCTLIQVPSGGNELLLINSELRIPLPIKQGLGLAVFYDGGNVFPDVGFHDFTALYTNNIGLGLRYATPVGPIRIDLGHNLNPVPGIKSTQYFISIGQAF
jgi:outer membrane protein insertion porin family